MNSLKRFFLILLSLTIFLAPLTSWAVTEKGFKNLHIFTKVLSYLEDNYVDEIDEEKVIRGAIAGMLGTLDPHTVYMSPEVFKELKVDTKGRFDGIGLEVAIRDGVLTVIAPISGTPADRAGIQPGDKIIRINGQSTEHTDLAEAITKMRGKRGTKVKLTIIREGSKKPHYFTIMRQAINVPSVRAERIDGYVYVHISSFQEGTAKELKKALKKLQKENSLHGLILDLRKNPGGLLDEAVAVSNLFLKKGIIVTTESRGQEVDRVQASEEGDKFEVPMIVLVDEGSASASEIVAGALQDNKQAMIFGSKTFGKGSVQTVVELDDGSGLKLTVARYFTPKGRSIQAHGIEPDVKVPAKAPKVELKEGVVREEALVGHLEAPEGKEPTSETPQDLTKDYQIKVALDYLKSWEIFQSKTNE
ncbi:MAG: S41 family peptidase [Pseudomonadota bacterium]